MKKELLLALSLMAATQVSNADTREQARRMFASLTGTVPSKQQLDIIENQIKQGQEREAARSIIDSQNGIETNGAFYNIVLKNMVSPWTSKDGSLYNPLNDMSATVIGVIRDETMPFKDILWRDVLYTAQGISPKWQMNADDRGWHPIKDCNQYQVTDGELVKDGSGNYVPIRSNGQIQTYEVSYSTYQPNDPEIEGRFIYTVGFGPEARKVCRLTKYVPIGYEIDTDGNFKYDENGDKIKLKPPANETVWYQNDQGQYLDEDGNVLADQNDQSEWVEHPEKNIVKNWLQSVEYVSEYIYLDSIDGFIEGSKILAHNNAHYNSLEALGVNLGDRTVFGPGSQHITLHGEKKAISGLLTTRGFGKAFITAGTNRAPIAYSMKYFMCKDMEELNDPTRPWDYNRKDVDRSPGGDSALFQNHCIGCHSGMDALAGAFAFYDIPVNKLEYTPGQIPEKIFRNEVTDEGHEVAGDVWVNYWSEGKNSSMGWGPISSGSGVTSLGKMFADTEAFHSCMVDQVFESICYRKPATDLEKKARAQLRELYVNSNYNMKKLFIETSIVCMGK